MANLSGYIKLHRKMQNWEWKNHPPTFCLFVHLLLCAAYQEERTDNGIILSPGQVAASLNTLSKETGLTVNQIRTALSHLQQTGEITVETSKGCWITIITIQNWAKYQPRESNAQGLETPETQADQDFSENSKRVRRKVKKESQGFSQGLAQGLSQGSSQGSSQGLDSPEAAQNNGLQESKSCESQGLAQGLSQGSSQGSSQGLSHSFLLDKKYTRNIKKYGEGGFVLLTDDEYQKLVKKYGEPFLLKCIERLDSYIGSIGKDKYKSHYYVINSGWLPDEVKKNNPGLMKPQRTTTTTPPESDPLTAWGGSL